MNNITNVEYKESRGIIIITMSTGDVYKIKASNLAGIEINKPHKSISIWPRYSNEIEVI